MTNADMYNEFFRPVVGGSPVFDRTQVPVKELYDQLDKWYNLLAFLRDFPPVSLDQALAALEERAHTMARSVVHSDESILGGAPVFKGTCVPVSTLFDYLADDYMLGVFLHRCSAVSWEQAVTAIVAAKELLLKEVHRTPNSIFHCHREIVSGAPVFVGTRLPVAILFDCLINNDNIAVFLEDFPTGNREQAVATLTMGRELLEKVARAAVIR